MYTSYVTRKGTLKQKNKSPISVAIESLNVFYVKSCFSDLSWNYFDSLLVVRSSPFIGSQT